MYLDNGSCIIHTHEYINIYVMLWKVSNAENTMITKGNKTLKLHQSSSVLRSWVTPQAAALYLLTNYQFPQHCLSVSKVNKSRLQLPGD